MTKRICILAGTRREFEKWLAENGKTDSEAVFAFEPERLMGHEFSRIEVIGTFWARPDAGRLHDLAKTRVR